MHSITIEADILLLDLALVAGVERTLAVRGTIGAVLGTGTNDMDRARRGGINAAPLTRRLSLGRRGRVLTKHRGSRGGNQLGPLLCGLTSSDNRSGNPECERR